MQKRPIILSILLTGATPYPFSTLHYRETLSLSHVQTPCLTHKYTYTQALFRGRQQRGSLSVSLTHTHTHRLSLRLSYRHFVSLTHTHTHKLSLCLTYRHLSHSRIHIHTGAIPEQAAGRAAHSVLTGETSQKSARHSIYWVATMHRMLQVSFRKRATNYRALLREMTYKDKTSYESSPPCTGKGL